MTTSYKCKSHMAQKVHRFPSLVCDLNRTPIVMAKHGGSCVHFSGISTCGRTSLPVYVIVTNKRLQPLTTTWYNLLELCFSLLEIYRRLIKHPSFLRALRSWGERCSAYYKFKFKYFIASYTWQGVHRVLCNKVSHTHENLTKHNIKKKLCWH